MRDYYEILGADRNTSDAELKKKFRKLAMQYHPDKNPGDKEAEEKFREVGQAYDVLKDPQRKLHMTNTDTAAFGGTLQVQEAQEVQGALAAFQIFLKICLATLWAEAEDKDNLKEDQISGII